MSLKEVNAYAANLKQAKKLQVVVGVTKDIGYTYEDGQTIQQVAAQHEYGTPRVHRRSFLRQTFLLKKKEVDLFIRKQFQQVVDGMDAKKALEIVGIEAENLVKDAFRTKGFGTWKDISEKTKEAKGSSAILIESGVLRGSITSAVI